MRPNSSTWRRISCPAASASWRRSASTIGSWRLATSTRSSPVRIAVIIVRASTCSELQSSSSRSLPDASTISWWKRTSCSTCSWTSLARAIVRTSRSSGATLPPSRSAAARAATSSSAARIGYISASSRSLTSRTHAPLNAADSTKRSDSRSRSASRTGAWLMPELLRDPGLDQPLAGRVLARQDALQQQLLDLVAQDRAVDDDLRGLPRAADRWGAAIAGDLPRSGGRGGRPERRCQRTSRICNR